MSVKYSPSYIDEIFERRDAIALHGVISVRAQDGPLPDQCLLFTRVLEWLGSDWQYYEAIQESDFLEICRLLKKYGMDDVLAKYEEGKSALPDSVAQKKWFDQHE